MVRRARRDQAARLDPAPAPRRRSHRGLDELDAASAVDQAGNCTAGSAVGRAGRAGADRLRDLGIERGEGLEIALGMAGRNARHPRRRALAAPVARAIVCVGSPNGDHCELVRLLLAPLEPAACCRRRAGAGCSRCRARPGSPRARRARRWRSAAAPARCRRGGGPATKVLSSAQQLARPRARRRSRRAGTRACRCRRRSRPRPSAPGRCATRPASGRWPRAARSASPARTRPGRRGSRRAGRPAPSARACAHHRVAGVVVGHARTTRPCLRRQRAEAASPPCSVVASGLSQMTWMPAFEEGLGDRRVQVVRRDDGDRLDAIAARRLGLRHRRVVGVACARGEAEREPGAPRLRRAGGERAGDQLVVVVEPRGDAMHGADEGAPSPPPTMPSRIRRLGGACRALSLRSSSRRSRSEAQHPPGLLRIGLAAGEVVERLLGDADDVLA